MSDILQDLSTAALVKAIKANMFEWYRYLGRSPNAKLYESPELTWLRTGISNSFVNTVMRTQLRSGNVDAAIEKVLACFDDLPGLSWWTEPGTQPPDLGQYLLAHGLVHTEGAAGMAADLLALPEDLPSPPGLAIERVGDNDALAKWAQASILGFGHPETDTAIWFDVFADLGFELPLRSYVGVADGEPVATSQMFLGAGVAGIYVVATVPGMRRRGFGAVLTLAPLQDARAMGYRIAILHASRMGFGAYRRLGFQEYCRMSHYEWVNKTSRGLR